MPARSPLLLAGLLALLLAPAAASQPIPAPTPTRVMASGGAVYADVYPDGVAAAQHFFGGRPPTAEAGGSFITLDVGEGPEADFLQDVAFTPAGDRVLTANARSNNIAVVDAATGVTLAVVPVGETPTAVAATDDVAVVTCIDGRSIYLIDLATYAVRDVVEDVPYPAGVRILPGGARALVASILGGGARILDLASGDVALTIPSFPYDGLELTIAFPSVRRYHRYQPLVPSVTGDTLFAVTDSPAPAVVLYSAATGALLNTYPTTVTPRTFGLSADGRTLVVGQLLHDRAVQAVDVATGAAAPPVPLPPGFVALISALAINADGTAVVVGLRRPNGTDPTAARIPLDGMPPTLIPTRSFEFGAMASPDGRLALGAGVDGAGVYDFASGTLEVLTPGRWYISAGFSPVAARWGGVPINHPGEVVSLFSAEGGPAHLGDVLPGGPVEGDSPTAVGISLDGSEALVANIYTSALTRVDLASKSVTGLVPLANVNPGRVVPLWDDLALVSGTDSTGWVTTTVLFDLASGAEVGRLPYARRLARGVEPYVFAWSDAHALVRLRATPTALEVVEASEDSLIARWDAARDGRLLAVADSTHDRVLFYGGASGVLLGTFAVPDVALVAVTPDAQWAFASNETDGTLHRFRFDGVAVAEEASIACGCGVPQMLATNEHLVGVLSPTSVHLFDAATGEAAGVVGVPFGSVSRFFITRAGEVVTLTENPHRIYFGSAVIDLPNRPTDVAYAPEHDLVLAIDKSNDAVIIGDVQPVAVEPGPAAGPLALRVFPNPTRGTVRVGYTWTGAPAAAELAVYDLLGRLVHRAEAPPHGPGRHALAWDPEAKASLPSGVYVVRLTVGDETALARVTVVR